MRPGTIISRSAARVEMSTQRAESGCAFPSRSPGISRNWRRTSATMPSAARPTAVIVTAAMKNGMQPPMKKPMTTMGSTRSRPPAGIPVAVA